MSISGCVSGCEESLWLMFPPPEGHLLILAAGHLDYNQFMNYLLTFTNKPLSLQLHMSIKSLIKGHGSQQKLVIYNEFQNSSIIHKASSWRC